jgi:hypothetical protein
MSENHGAAPVPGLPGNGGRILLAMLWPGMILLGLIMLTATGLVAVAFLVAPSGAIGDLGHLVGQANSISKLVALIVIVPAIVTLAMLDKINGAATIAALAAIAGYVLGNASGGGAG